MNHVSTQLFLIGIVAATGKRTVTPDFFRLLKVSCSSTGVICPQVYCKSTSISRYRSLLNFGCESFNGPITPMLYSITISLKTASASNFRQVFQFKHVDACDLLENPEKYPLLKDGIKGFDKAMPGIIQKCPYKVLKVCNATVGTDSSFATETNFNIFLNGVYKFALAIANAKEKPSNYVSIDFFFEWRTHAKNFQASV